MDTHGELEPTDSPPHPPVYRGTASIRGPR